MSVKKLLIVNYCSKYSIIFACVKRTYVHNIDLIWQDQNRIESLSHPLASLALDLMDDVVSVRK
jgi:hypothetical protein